MTREQLRHEVAMVMARHLLAIVAGCLREDECSDAFKEFYGVVRSGLERFEAQVLTRRNRVFALESQEAKRGRWPAG